MNINRINKKLDNYLNTFMQEEIGDNKISAIPSIDNKPSISNIKYNQSNDTFSIIFDNYTTKNIKTLNGYISFEETLDGNIIKIEISNFKKLRNNDIHKNINSQLEKKLNETKKSLKNSKNNIANYLVSKRIMQFFYELIKNDLNSLFD